jgi:hypothetical protein
MPVTVTRIYESQEKATEAADALKQKNFAPGDVLLVTPGHDSAATALSNAGVDSERAGAYAEAVSRGRSVVTVVPHFGGAHKAAEILDSFGPTDTHISDVPNTVNRRGKTKVASSTDSNTSSNATPLSSAAGWRVLSDDPTPLSTKWNLKVLSDKATPLSDWFGWSTLSKDNASKTVLIDDPTWLSSKLNLRVLSDDPAPVSGKFGWRILSDDPTPLSSKFGWKVLSENQEARATLTADPAPLSSTLGIPTKSKDPS